MMMAFLCILHDAFRFYMNVLLRHAGKGGTGKREESVGEKGDTVTTHAPCTELHAVGGRGN